MRKVFLLMALCLMGAFVFAPAALAQNEFNCDDFDTQPQAQAVFDQDPSDPNMLDDDGDGIACETLPGGDDGRMGGGGGITGQQYNPTATQYQYGGGGGTVTDTTATPTAVVDDLPETGGASVLALGAGVLLVTGGLVARRVVR